jgi:type IV pilus assembly protein PilM
MAEAEALKISAGTGQPVPQEVSSALSQTNEVVADEIKRSFDFYVATANNAHVQKVYVTGGGLGIPGLFEQIQTALNLPLESLNPFLKVKYDSSRFKYEYIAQISPYASVGLGLAMRKKGDR